MNSTTTKPSELLATQFNADENQNKDKSSELIKREPIDGSPFWLIWTQEKQYFITFDKYQLTQSKPTKEDAIEELNYNMLNVICMMVNILIVKNSNMEQQITTEKNKQQQIPFENK